MVWFYWWLSWWHIWPVARSTAASSSFSCPLNRDPRTHLSAPAATLQQFKPSIPPWWDAHICPLASWIRKVLLCLSDRVSNIDLNSLTQLIPDDSTLSPQPLNPSSWLSLSRNVFTVEMEASPVCPQVLPLVQINSFKERVGEGRTTKKKKKT